MNDRQATQQPTYPSRETMRVVTRLELRNRFGRTPTNAEVEEVIDLAIESQKKSIAQQAKKAALRLWLTLRK